MRNVKCVRFSHGSVFFDSHNVQTRATKSDSSGHCQRTTPRRPTRGSRASTSPTTRSGSLSTSLKHPALLYWLPDELGRIRRRCRRASFTHIVGYRTPTAACAGEVDTLLDPATYGSRWVSLTRVAPSG